ncbi:MAG: YbaK/EbsC family protein [bacterium]
MPIEKLKDFLDEKGVRYVTLSHSKAYTAQEIAAAAHIPGREVAKTVIVKLDGELAMAVLPASYQVDLHKLKKASGAEDAEIATEEEFKGRFPASEVGAMPPFGNLYDMEVYVSRPLDEDERIAFNAGSHTEMIQMDYEDFQRLVEPTVADFVE